MEQADDRVCRDASMHPDLRAHFVRPNPLPADWFGTAEVKKHRMCFFTIQLAHKSDGRKLPFQTPGRLDKAEYTGVQKSETRGDSTNGGMVW
jgi:hypothetical protein